MKQTRSLLSPATKTEQFRSVTPTAETNVPVAAEWNVPPLKHRQTSGTVLSNSRDGSFLFEKRSLDIPQGGACSEGLKKAEGYRRSHQVAAFFGYKAVMLSNAYLEMTRAFITREGVYIQKNSCNNTLLRLVTLVLEEPVDYQSTGSK